MVLGIRDLMVLQRTQTVNALRGYTTEFGMIAPKGLAQVEPLLERFSTTEEIPSPRASLTVSQKEKRPVRGGDRALGSAFGAEGWQGNRLPRGVTHRGSASS